MLTKIKTFEILVKHPQPHTPLPPSLSRHLITPLSLLQSRPPPALCYGELYPCPVRGASSPPWRRSCNSLRSALILSALV